MTELFLSVLDMSLTASYVIAVILFARLCLRRAPKKYSYALWSVAAFRLVCPVSPELPISLFSVRLRFNSGSVDLGQASQNVVEDYIEPALTQTVTAVVPEPLPGASADPIQIVVWVAALIWCAGMAAMLLYALVSLLRLHRQMSTAIRLEGKVWQSDRIASPFILGIVRPRIYIPFGLEGEQLNCVLAHEGFHLKRFDHIVKPVAYLILTLHWFNPLVWIAFRCMSRDMEMRCDEQVLEQNKQVGKDYSATLLSFASERGFPAPSPLAFGETGVSQRIKNVLRWKKPRLWVTVIGVVISLFVIVGCAVNPFNKAARVVGEYDASTLGGEFLRSGNPAYDVGANCYGMPVFKDPNAAWEAMLEDYAEGLGLIAEYADLGPITKYNYEAYKAHGWYAPYGWTYLIEQCNGVSQFLDIYENSFIQSSVENPVSTAGSITYSGRGGGVLAQHIAVSSEPNDGSYYAGVTLKNGVLTIINSENELLYQGSYDSTERWSREALIEKMCQYPLGNYDVGFGDIPEVWDAYIPRYDGLNMECLTFLNLESGEVAWKIYVFNGEPTWLMLGDCFGCYELVPTE